MISYTKYNPIFSIVYYLVEIINSILNLILSITGLLGFYRFELGMDFIFWNTERKIRKNRNVNDRSN